MEFTLSDIKELLKETEENIKAALTKTFEDLVTEKINTALISLRNENKATFDGYRKELDDYKNQFKDQSEEFENIKNENLKLKKSLNEMTEESDQIRKYVDYIDEQNHRLMDSMEKLEQYGRRENLEFHGIPNESPGVKEDLDYKVQLLLSKVGFELKKEHISTSHRLKAGNPLQPQPVIMRFTNRNVRNKIFALRSLFHPNKFSYKDCGLQGITRLYINDNLTAKRRKLFKETKELAKSCSPPYKFVWTANNEILVKKDKDQNSTTLKISSYYDLSNKLEGQPRVTRY